MKSNWKKQLSLSEFNEVEKLEWRQRKLLPSESEKHELRHIKGQLDLIRNRAIQRRRYEEGRR